MAYRTFERSQKRLASIPWPVRTFPERDEVASNRTRQKRRQRLDGDAGKRSYGLISIIRINSLACWSFSCLTCLNRIFCSSALGLFVRWYRIVRV